MMTDQVEHLFVYGTLLPGYGNHARIAGHIHNVRPGTTQGILVDLGAFPALIPGKGRVKGIVLDVDAEALAITDFIEGYHADGGRSLYIREKVQVDLGDGDNVKAWTYFYAHADHIQDFPRLHVGDDDGLSVYSWPAQ